MKVQIIFMLMVLIGSCKNNQSVNSKIIQNETLLKFKKENLVVIDKHLSIYIPKTILNAGLSYLGGFDIYHYEFFNSMENLNKVKIQHWNLYDFMVYGENTGENAYFIKLEKDYDHPKYDSLKIESIKINSKIYKYLRVINCFNDSNHITTYATYKISPATNRGYLIHIECDNSKIGRLLNDSALEIIGSVKFNWLNEPY